MADQDCTAGELRARLETIRAGFREALHAPNTRLGYGFDWRAFVEWCETIGAESLPASEETLSLHMMSLFDRNLKCSSVARRISAVSYMHNQAGLPTPYTKEIRKLLRGARRAKLDEVRQVDPLRIEHLRKISVLLGQDNTDASWRNRAIMVTGFASALRSANLAGLHLADVEFTAKGLILVIRKEKQDQEGKGRILGIPHGKHSDTCPVHCLNDWIERRGTWEGPLFSRVGKGRDRAIPLGAERFSIIVQACVRRIGLSWRDFGSHSLRAGFITEAAEAGVSDLLIASQSGHADMDCLRRYFRRTDVFRVNPLASLDL